MTFTDEQRQSTLFVVEIGLASRCLSTLMSCPLTLSVFRPFFKRHTEDAAFGLLCNHCVIVFVLHVKVIIYLFHVDL